jgi:transcription elongation factor GreA
MRTQAMNIEANTIFLTSKGVRKLQYELNRLKAYIKELQLGVRDAALNFEEEILSEKRIELQSLEERLHQLESIFNRVRVLKHEPSSRVEIGSLVTYRNNGSTTTVRLVNSLEANPAESRVSFRSPLGSALFDKKAGDESKMITPQGERIIEVLKVR